MVQKESAMGVPTGVCELAAVLGLDSGERREDIVAANALGSDVDNN